MGNKIRIKQIDLQGIFSASGQVNLLSASNYVSFVTQLDATMSSDSELAAVSSSISQSVYTIRQTLGSGLVSGSTQLTSSFDTRYTLSGSIPNIPTGSFATTGSNTFSGNQIISGSVGISANSGSWNFLQNGTLVLPNGTGIYGNGLLQIDVVGGFLLTSYTDQFGSGSQEWYFHSDGTLNVPGNIEGADNLLTTASFNTFTQSYYSTSASFDSRVESLENETSSYLTSLDGAISSSTQISDLGFVTGSYTTINSFNSLTQSFNSISQSFNVISGSVGTIDFSTLATTGSNIFSGSQTISGGLSINNSGYSWSFESNGRTKIPNITFNSDRGTGMVGIKPAPGREFQIETSTAESSVGPWSFGLDGTLSAPVGANILRVANLVTTSSFNNFTGSVATTGSNQFNGNQTITGSLVHGNPGNIATGEKSHAEGEGTQAIGNFSHAEGLGTIAYANYSHAEGQDTIASGSHSHTEGNQTIALGNHQHVQGQYNAVSSVPSAFIVGNGTDSENRSNLIHAAGNEVQITGSLKVSGSIFLNQGDILATNGVISGSSQLTSSFDTRYATSASYLTSLNGAISSSSQLTSSYDTRYTLSGSVQPLPNGLISGSSQLTSSFDTRYALSASFVSSSNVSSIQTITSASYAALTPVSGTLYIIIG
jgi:hypothetical protein